MRSCSLPIAAAFAGLVPILSTGCASQRAAVSIDLLLGEMTDLSALAEFPDPPFTCRQFSSYDREAKSPEENWFANNDRGQFLRVEQHGDRSEYVMMDADGPGAIVRIWSANPAGTLRVYVDGADQPVIAEPLEEFLSGETVGVPKPIAGERSRGYNSYLPIPYQRHCKVTSDAGDFYYHVDYRTYPRGTKVRGFARADLLTSASAIETVAKLLASPREIEPPTATRKQETPPFRIAPGERTSPILFTTLSPHAIRSLRVRVEARDLPAALRQTLLTIEFDGNGTVACPLGDFFGGAPGITPYASLPAGMDEDGWMWCRWVMPFQRRAVVRLVNKGEQLVRVSMGATASPLAWTNRTMYFHAKWRADLHVPTRPMQDWNYLDARGRGVFVGASFTIANPTRTWWGEGDEKIYVDGEAFPSFFGTGTEDYFGYAWCSNETFTHAYHNQPRCDGPGNYGHTSVNRWHILDRIPFRKRFRFDMELWHWVEDTHVDMTVTAYWYARPGGTDGFAPIETDDLVMNVMPPYAPMRVDGAIEGEAMRIIEQTATADPQEVAGCSNDGHLWWRGGQQVGDRLVLGFDVEAAGTYRVWGRFVKARDYGIVQLSINDRPAGDPIDFYHSGVVVSDEIDLGTFNLIAGENRITAEVIGANESAVKAHMFGLDYLRIETIEP